MREEDSEPLKATTNSSPEETAHPRTDFVIRTMAALSMLIGAVGFLLWFDGANELLSLAGSVFFFNAALALFLCGAALLLHSFAFLRWSVLLALTSALISGVSVAEALFEFDAGLDQLFVQDLLSPDTQIPGRMSLQTGLAILVLSLALLFTSSRATFARSPLVLTICALLACSVSVTSLLRILSGLDPEHSPAVMGFLSPTSTAPQAAVGIAFLSFGVLALAWREWNSFSWGLFELRRALLVYSSVVALFIAGVTSWFALSLLHERITQEAKSNLEYAARARAHDIEILLWRVRAIARRFSGFSDAQRILEELDEAQRTEDRSFKLSTTQFDRILEYEKNIRSITLLDRAGKPLVVLGDALSPELWPENVAERETIGIVGPEKIGESFRIVVSVPIVQVPLRRLGTAILMLEADSFAEMLRKREILGETGNFYLGVPNHKTEEVRVLSYPRGALQMNEQVLDEDSRIYQSIQSALKQESGFVATAGQHTHSRLFVVYLPVPDSELALVATIDGSEVGDAVNHRFLSVCGLILLFLILAGYGMYLLIRTILSYADELQMQLEDNSKALEAELLARKSAEQELMKHRDKLEELVLQRTEKLEDSQRKLYQSERMASIGIFAAGIAHEINNPIGMILCSAQNALELKAEPDAPEITENALQEIESNAKRCGKIVKSVLQFSRQEETEKWLHDLNKVVERAVRLTLKLETRKTMRVSTSFAEELPKIRLNPIEIEQVVVNLVKNAHEAGGSGTEVEVVTRKGEQSVELLITDSGPGIEEERLKNIFDPFFTTKQNRGGTGLGMSIVHGVVKSHRGEIFVESSLGVGTSIRIVFPVEA